MCAFMHAFVSVCALMCSLSLFVSPFESFSTIILKFIIVAIIVKDREIIKSDGGGDDNPNIKINAAFGACQNLH